MLQEDNEGFASWFHASGTTSMPLRYRKRLSLKFRKVDGSPCPQYDRHKPAQKGDLHLAEEQDLMGRYATGMEESATRDGEADAAVREGHAHLLEMVYRNGLDRG